MKRSKIPLLIGLLVATLVVALVALFDLLQQQLYREQLRSHVTDQAYSACKRLESALNARLAASQGLVTYIAHHPDLSRADFEAFASALVEHEPKALAVELVRGTVLTEIHPPPADPAVLGQDLRHLPSRRDGFLQALASLQPTVDGPGQEPDGVRRLWLRIPVYLTLEPTQLGAGAYWGMVNLQVDPERLAAETGVHDGDGLAFAVLRPGAGGLAERLVCGQVTVVTQAPVTAVVHLPNNGMWELAAAPAEGWDAAMPNRWVLRIGGGLLALLAGLLAGLRSGAPARLRRAVAESTAALRESEEKLSTLFAHSPDFVLMLAADGRILYANRRLGGRPAADLINRKLDEITQPGERAKLRDGLARVFTAGEIVEFDGHHVSADKTEAWFHTRLVPVRRDGTVIAAMSISSDITAKVAGERELRESEERFRRAFAESPMGLIMLGLDYRILQANDSLCRMLGYSTAEMTRMTLAEISPADEFERDQQNISKSLQSEDGVIRRVKRYRHKDGHEIVCNLTGTLMRNSAGKPIHMLGMLEDITGRKQAEDGLRAAEARNRAILNAIPDIIQRVDRQGRFLYFQPGGEQTRFVDLATVLQKTVQDFFPPETAARFMAVVEKTLTSGELQQFEICLERDGKALDYDVRVAVCGPDEVLVLVRNITAQKRSREMMQAILEGTSHEVGEDFLRSLVKILANTLHVRFGFISEFLDPNGGRARLEVLWADDRFLPTFDYTRPGATGVTGGTGEQIGSGERAHVIAGLRAASAPARPILDPGPEGYLAVPLHDSEGAVCGSMGILHDQPLNHDTMVLSLLQIFAVRASVELQRKRTEIALRESEERFRRLSEASFEGLVLHEKGIVIDCNRVVADMFGYRIEELIGKAVVDFTSPETRAEVLRRIVAGDERPYEAEGVRRDGSRFFCELLPRMVPFHGRQVRVTALRDITERKRAETERRLLEGQVQHSQKLESLGVMAGGIAHDFNNLLTGVLGHASLAQLELGEDSPARNAIQQIELAARRAADLTNQLLAYSGKGRFVVQSVDLSRLVQEMARLLAVSIPKKIQLSYNFADPLSPIEADVTQVRQVVMNLITNAADAIGAHAGTIQVRTGQEVIAAGYQPESYLELQLQPGVYAFLEVADDGCGMDVDTQARIFEPFFTTKFTGRGLGLAAVLGIVRGHRGALRVDSRPGRGTTFRILLPVGAATDTTPRPRPKTDSFFIGQGTVLVVDDEESVRTVARLMLQKFGFRVLMAADGKEAVEVFSRHHRDIQVVLLDMTMPKMSGEEVYREMVKIRPDITVLLSSGYSEQEAVSRFGVQGLAGFIQKPYRTMELVQAVQAALSEP